MFALTKTDGTWVTSTRTGHRLTWTSRQLARMAAKALAGTYGALKVVEA